MPDKLKRNLPQPGGTFALLGATAVLAAIGLISRLPTETARAQNAGPQAPANSPADVRDFGAVGDGKTDDTAAIQRTVDARIGGVRFPRGVYRITKTIEVDLDRVGPTSITGDGTARIVMAGPGPAFRLTGTHEGTAAPHTVKPNVWRNQRTPLVDGIEIVGDHPQANGIELTGTMQPTITRVSVRDALHGVHLVKRNRNVIISECHFYDNRGVGVFLDGVNLHQINIVDCHISYNDGGGVVVKGSEVRNLQIGSCDIEGNMGTDGPSTANVLVDCTNGSMREGAIVGCTIQHTHDAPDSANVRFIGHSRELPLRVGNFAIADNAMSDVAVNIHLQNARGVTITGNTLWKAFSHNLLAEGSSHIVMGANLCDRNPEYRPADSKNGLLFRDCWDCTISGLHINNTLEAPAALLLRECRWMNVTGCTVLDCDNIGIWLDNCEYCRVSDCAIRDQREGREGAVAIRISAGKGNMAVDNLLAGKLETESGQAAADGNLQVKTFSQ